MKRNLFINCWFIDIGKASPCCGISFLIVGLLIVVPCVYQTLGQDAFKAIASLDCPPLLLYIALKSAKNCWSSQSSFLFFFHLDFLWRVSRWWMTNNASHLLWCAPVDVQSGWYSIRLPSWALLSVRQERFLESAITPLELFRARISITGLPRQIESFPPL